MHNQFDIDNLFEGVYNKLISPEFGKNLGGERPLYVQPFPSESQLELDNQIKRLSTRLNKKGIDSMLINLYDLCIDVLQERGTLDKILSKESTIRVTYLFATLTNVLDVKRYIIPGIQQRIQEKDNVRYIFIYGVGHCYPFLRSHMILNNIVNIAANRNIILFFPGEYDNLRLKLFGIISDENYYRGFNLNDIK